MKDRKWMKMLLLIDQIGISMIVAIFVGVFIGILLDNLTGLSPLFLVIFMVLGIGAGFRNVYQIIDRELKRGEKEDD